MYVGGMDSRWMVVVRVRGVGARGVCAGCNRDQRNNGISLFRLRRFGGARLWERNLRNG